MATVYASGSRPQACRNGHPWNGNGSMILSWVTCECAGAQTARSGYGHHRIRCLTEGCNSVWYDPPHTATISPRPQ